MSAKFSYYIEEATADFVRINQQFSAKPLAKQMLERAVDSKLSIIIDRAGDLMKELTVDLRLLSESITRLADCVEEFVSVHLQLFCARQFGTIEQISTSPLKTLVEP